MTKTPLTIIKLCGSNFRPTHNDINRWREIFDKAETDPNYQIIIHKAIEDKEITVEKFEPTEKSITLIKIGNEEYIPTAQDLEFWRQLFEEAVGDPDFKIITHGPINIENIPFDTINTKILKIE